LTVQNRAGDDRSVDKLLAREEGKGPGIAEFTVGHGSAALQGEGFPELQGHEFAGVISTHGESLDGGGNYGIIASQRQPGFGCDGDKQAP
jgi:hypothetical protein